MVKIAQLASLAGPPSRVAQPETPVTLQFQGNKFTLSHSQLRQLTAGQPLQLQGKRPLAPRPSENRTMGSFAAGDSRQLPAAPCGDFQLRCLPVNATVNLTSEGVPSEGAGRTRGVVCVSPGCPSSTHVQ